MHIITAIIRTLHALEKDLELTQNTLVRKLTVRVHNMCSSTDTKHTTLMRFNHQSIVRLFENMTTLNKKGQKQSPIVDATDVQKLMLSLPYLLDGLADEELAVFNAGPGRVRGNAVADPIPAAIMAVNEWLHWYKLYRKEAPDEDDVIRLTRMGKSLLRTLVKVFPFTVKVGLGQNNVRSMWANEKVHSILHAPRNIYMMGRAKNISCQVTETRHKGIKIKGLKTNRNPASVGFSIMNQEARDDALVALATKLDSSGPCWKRRRVSHCPPSQLEGDSRNDSASDSESDSDPDGSGVLKAMRYFERDEKAKTTGCLADGLRCNVWARAHEVESMRYSLVKGWTAVKGQRRGELGLDMQDINWTAASGGQMLTILQQLPWIAYLSNKVVHYLVDYHHEWLVNLPLDIPVTDGTHKQLGKEHFQAITPRFEHLPLVKKPFQVFSAVKLEHNRFIGGQTVHAAPFNISKPRMVIFAWSKSFHHHVEADIS